jgi:hypothetical protein
MAIVNGKNVVLLLNRLNLQEKTVTENGEVVPDVEYTGLSKVIVNVPQGSVIELTTESEMEMALTNATADDNGNIYLYTGESGTYENGAYYVLEYTE